MPNETLIRLAVFGGLLVLFAALEALAPRRKRALPRTGRWITNLGMTVLNTLALRAMALGRALSGGGRGCGCLDPSLGSVQPAGLAGVLGDRAKPADPGLCDLGCSI